MIEVEDGLVIELQFTAFDIQYDFTYCASVCCDHLTIRDGDGTTLMEKNCGNSVPVKIISRSNTVEVYFETNYWGSKPGWSFTWSAVTSIDQGELASYVHLGNIYITSFFSKNRRQTNIVSLKF